MKRKGEKRESKVKLRRVKRKRVERNRREAYIRGLAGSRTQRCRQQSAAQSVLEQPSACKHVGDIRCSPASYITSTISRALKSSVNESFLIFRSGRARAGIPPTTHRSRSTSEIPLLLGLREREKIKKRKKDSSNSFFASSPSRPFLISSA